MSSKKKEPVILSDTIEFPKFDEELGGELKSLCDRVCCNLNVTLNSHRELAQFKQTILDQKIPPNVLVSLSVLSGDIVKNGLDLQSLVMELVKIVQKNSYLLQEHMPKFVKLCDDYKRKCGQLDVALRKLELQDEKFKRIQRVEILQNWELLFTKVQAARSHGRRWKYRMFDFKERVKKGPEAVSIYFKQLLDEDDGIVKKEPEVIQEEEEVEKEDEEQIELEDVEEFEEEELEDEEYQESIEEKEQESPEPVEMKDATVSTSDVDFTQTLVMRIYNPKGLSMYGDLQCRLQYGKDLFETDNLNKTKQAKEEEEQIEKEYEEAIAAKEGGTSKSKGLIGKKKSQKANVRVKTQEEIKKLQYEKQLRDLQRNEEIRINIPTNVINGLTEDPLYNSVRIKMLPTDSTSEPPVGQATIDIEELLTLDLPVYQEPVFRGDMVGPIEEVQEAEDDSSGNKEQNQDSIKEELSTVPFPALNPMLFPIVEITDPAGKKMKGIQIGQLPIALYWSRKEVPVIYHRATETYSINDLVEDLTGINLRLITKEELTREKIDESLSPRTITPLPETVLKEEYDKMINEYMNELETLDNTYKEKLEELQDKMDAQITKLKEEAEIKLSEAKVIQSRPKSSSVYHQDCGTSPIFPYRPVPPVTRQINSTSRPKQSDESTRRNLVSSSKSRDTLSTMGGPEDQEEVIYLDEEAKEENEKSKLDSPTKVSGNFIERMSVYSELSTKHQEQIRKQIKREVSGAIEMKLAELKQLHDNLTDEDIETALADMCLPAVFMPFSNASGTIFNPRAHQYFHPNNLKYLRLSQPPSILKLPPIKEQQMSVLNLFDIGTQLQVNRIPNIAVARKSLLTEKNIPNPPETTQVTMDTKLI